MALLKDVYIYPGSFDPVTYGHLDVIERASRLCRELVVAIGVNRVKASTLFTVEERIEMIEESLRGTGIGAQGNIRVEGFTGLLAEFARKTGASAIIKGLRAISDFEYEFQMALLNKHIDDRLETVFLMTSLKYTFLSSSAVKELAQNNASLDGLVPGNVSARLRAKMAEPRD